MQCNLEFRKLNLRFHVGNINIELAVYEWKVFAAMHLNSNEICTVCT